MVLYPVYSRKDLGKLRSLFFLFCAGRKYKTIDINQEVAVMEWKQRETTLE